MGKRGKIKMTTIQTEAILRIFSQFGIKDPMDKYMLYLHALIARSVFTEFKDEKSFNNFEDAWKSSIALSMREYLPKESIDLQVVTSLAEQINETTGLDFIYKIIPNLMINNAEMLFEYLEQERWEKTDRTLFYLLLKIWAVIQVQRKIIANPYPQTTNQVNKKVVSSLLFKEYISWQDDYPKFAEIRNFGEEEFFRTWCFLYGSLFSPVSVKIKQNISQHFEMLKQKKCPEEVILAYYLMARTGKRFRINEIDSPWDYFQSVFFDGLTEEDRKQSRSLGELFYQEKYTLEQFIVEWRNINPRDFLQTFYYLGQRDASQIIEWENCIMYTKLHQMLQSSSSAVIVDPSPNFVFRCLEDESFAGKDLIFVLPSEALAQIYEMEFSGKAMFAYAPIEKIPQGTPGRKRKNELEQGIEKIISQENQIQNFIQISLDSTYKGREPIFQRAKVESKYNIGVVFSRQKSLWELPSFLKMIPKSLAENGILLFHAPQSLINENRYGVLNSLPQNACNTIYLLPNNQKCEWLKKQLLMIFSFDKKSISNEKVDLWKFFNIPFDEGQGRKNSSDKKFVCQEPWSLKVPKLELFSRGKTINHLFELHRKSSDGEKTQKNTRETKCFRFSREIKIWYSLSNGKGKFALYEMPSPEQTRKNPLARGKRATNFVPFRAKCVSEAEQKIQKKILEKPMWSLVQKILQEGYQGKSLSLKSFWFCNLDKLRKNNNYRNKFMMELVFSPSFSNILSTDVNPLEQYKNWMETDFNGRSKEDTIALWRQLNLLLNLGGNCIPRCFYPNPINNHVISLVEEELDFRRVRGSLTIKSFTIGEELVILNHIESNLPQKSIYLGAAISFYTGMSNSEISALNWDDYQSISGKTGKQFLIYKQVQSNGGVKGFWTERKNEYRRIPIVGALRKLLDERKKYLLETLSKSSGREMKDADIKNYPIVLKDESNPDVRCSLDQLSRYKKKLEAATGYKSMEGGIRGNGQKERRTDFNQYYGDHFHENFRYRAAETCLLTLAEQNYLLGISLPDTFSKHYCDFANDFLQLMMAQKLERWSVLHHQNTAENASEIALTGEQQVIPLSKKKCNHRVCIDLDIVSEPLSDEDAQLILNIEDSCGVDIEFYATAIGENNYE